MKTLVERGGDRIWCDCTPEQIRDLLFPGATLVPLQTNLKLPTLAGTLYCRIFRIEKFGHTTGCFLVEIPG